MAKTYSKTYLKNLIRKIIVEERVDNIRLDNFVWAYKSEPREKKVMRDAINVIEDAHSIVTKNFEVTHGGSPSRVRTFYR